MIFSQPKTKCYSCAQNIKMASHLPENWFQSLPWASRSCRTFTCPSPPLYLCWLPFSMFVSSFMFRDNDIWPPPFSGALHILFPQQGMFLLWLLPDTLSYFILLCWKSTCAERSSLIKLPKVGHYSAQTHRFLSLMLLYFSWYLQSDVLYFVNFILYFSFRM